MPTILDPDRVTPLLEAIRACTPDERVEFAELAGTTESYLYAMAGAQREPLTTRSLAVAKASVIMNERSKGRIPVITVEQIGEMFKGKS